MQEVLHVVGGSTPLDHPFFFSISIPFFFFIKHNKWGRDTAVCIFIAIKLQQSIIN